MRFAAFVLGVFLAAFALGTTVTKGTHITIAASGTTPACSSGTVSVGTLGLIVSSPRTAGIGVLTVFIDASASTDSAAQANETAYEDDLFTINYGDSGSISGSSTWAYGSRPNSNTRNQTYGADGAHLYVITPGGGDQSFTITVSQYNGTSTASCTVPVTVYDPWGANGYTKVVCVGNTAPTKGSGGCPNTIGNGTVTTLTTSTISTVLGQLVSGAEVLMRCGDTYSGGGDNGFNSIATGHLGAFGGCENTKTNRPILKSTATAPSQGFILLPAFTSTTMGDFRFTDFDCQSTTALKSGGCINFSSNNNNIPYQVTMYNLKSANSAANYYWSHGAQFALIDSYAGNQDSAIGTFVNVDGNGTGVWTGSPVNNINYQAVMGSYIAGTGDTSSGAGDESLRISACQHCIMANNEFKDANTTGAVFKLFQSNNYSGGGSKPNFAGIPIQYMVISDNYLHGKSGAFLSEITQQNTCNDERFYDIIFERNVWTEDFDNLGDFILVSGQRIVVRDNAGYIPSGFTHPSFYHLQFATRASAATGAQAGCPYAAPTTGFQTTQYLEIYNNVVYALSYHSPQTMLDLDSNAPATYGNAAANSYIANNMYFSPSGSTTYVNTGSGNTFSTNTTTTTNNPGMTDASGTFKLISDYKPTANYSSGGTVPVYIDGVGIAWPPTWDLGAVHH